MSAVLTIDNLSKSFATSAEEVHAVVDQGAADRQGTVEVRIPGANVADESSTMLALGALEKLLCSFLSTLEYAYKSTVMINVFIDFLII